MTTRLMLIRHGATVLSAEDRFAGSTDVELSDVGCDQAEALARRLADDHVTAVYASPLRRTVATAAIIGRPHGLEPILRGGLREIDHGRWEGLPRVEVETHFADEYAAWEEDPYTFAPAGGESGHQRSGAGASGHPRDRATPRRRERGGRVAQGDHPLDSQHLARLRCARLPRPAGPVAGVPERAGLQGPRPRPADAVQRRLALYGSAAARRWAPVQVVGPGAAGVAYAAARPVFLIPLAPFSGVRDTRQTTTGHS